MSELIYIAGPFFSPDQKLFIQEIEDILDFRQQKYFSPREYGVIVDIHMTTARTQRIFDMNIRMISESNCMIAITDDFDPGTMFEIGAFHELGNLYGREDHTLITYSPTGYGSNVMIAQSAWTHCRSIGELGHALDGHQVGEEEVTE